MKNNYSRLVIIALITIIVFLYALTVKGYAAGIPAALQETVIGVVTDEQGMPLPGVTVTVKGTNRGTATNIDGEYEIAVDAQGTLVFSFLGFKKAEVAVAGQREINVRLAEDITALDEVEINAGYYNTTRRESTGNISRVTAEEIELQPVVSPLQALQGRMAGVEVIPGGSHPGMAPTIRIRGKNSLREDGNFPLYIIDGVPVNSSPIESNSILGSTGIDPLNTLNLSNIASIEVLKDADATAIYGSRGANGIVLITTKKGQHGRFQLEAQLYSGVSTAPNRMKLLNTEQYLEIRRQAFENDQTEPDIFNAYDLVLWDSERYTDWQDFFFGGTAPINDINLSASGGSENTTFRLSGSFHEQGTIYPADYKYQKGIAALAFQHISSDKKLNLSISLNYGLDKNKIVGNVDLSSYAFSLPPNAPRIFEENGDLHWSDWDEIGWENPLSGFHNNSDLKSTNLISNFTASYLLLDGLRIKTSLGYSNFSSGELIKLPKRSYSPAYWDFINHRSIHLDIDRNSWIIEPQLSYEEEWGRMNFSTLVGVTFEENNYNRTSLQGEGYVTESLIGNLASAQEIINAEAQNSEYRYNALFARVGLDWGRKYFLNFTGRRDGSSRFGPDKKVANFGAIGAAWIFTEEDFFHKNFNFLSFGKIRGSYGTTGNDQIGDYGYLDAYEATAGPGGIYPVQLSNPNFSWEVNKKIEASLDLGFIEDRISLGLSWYRNRSSNQLVGYSLPYTTGFNVVQANLLATVQNKGWEVELNSINLQKKNFYWQTSINLSVPENKLLNYPNLEQSSYANIYRKGHPLEISLLYQYGGIDPSSGLYIVEDSNEDGRIDYEDRIIVQNLGREFFGGISNQLSYKNFSLDFLLQFAKQDGKIDLFNAGELKMQRSEVLEALQDQSPYQQISQSPLASTAYYNVLETTFPIVDASFARLKNLSLAYSLPDLDSLGIQYGKIFLTGQNLFTLTEYEGMDPEAPAGGTQFSNLRTVTGGIQLTF